MKKPANPTQDQVRRSQSSMSQSISKSIKNSGGRKKTFMFSMFEKTIFNLEQGRIEEGKSYRHVTDNRYKRYGR